LIQVAVKQSLKVQYELSVNTKNHGFIDYPIEKFEQTKTVY
jgi:hypothetical protein